MLDTRPITIYGLVDPRTDKIRYVGKTVHETTRLRTHINEARRLHRRGERLNHKNNWIISLVTVEVEPFLVILETVPPYGDWEGAETRWIASIPDLTNGAAGGQGPHGFKVSDETRARLSAARKLITGWHHSEETKRKIGDAQRGKPRQPMSEEAKRKISEYQLGRPKSEVTRAKMSAWQVGKEHSQETKDRISASLTGKTQPVETRQRHSATSTRLDWPDRETLLRMKETMTYRGIGEMLGISPSTVQTRIWRLRERGW